MSILVAGIAKSGTSALFYKIINSVPDGSRCLFEPTRSQITGDEVLIKSLIGDARPDYQLYQDLFGNFEKRVFIVRDPRDRIVSEMLYINATWRFVKSESDLNEWLDLLMQKEKSPASISVKELLGSYYFWNYQLQLDCCDQYDHYLFKYEDLVDGNFEGLEDYLGVKLTGDIKMADHLSRVVRSKRYGNWRNWLTPEDVAHFRPRFEEFMCRFGYDFDDWELSENPVIDPKLSSEYVKREYAPYREMYERQRGK